MKLKEFEDRLRKCREQGATDETEVMMYGYYGSTGDIDVCDNENKDEFAPMFYGERLKNEHEKHIWIPTNLNTGL
jgi:hypothetical protein